MKHEGNRRPNGDRYQSEVRTTDQRRDRQENEIRIASRRDLPEECVDRAPDVDLNLEYHDRQPFDDPL